MLQVFSPPAPAVAPTTSSFEELDSCSSNSTAAAVTDAFGSSSSQQGVATAAKAAGVTTSEYCDQLDIAKFFLEMAATRPFSLQDETSAAAETTTTTTAAAAAAAAPDISSTLPPASAAMTASSDTLVPQIRGGRIPTIAAIIDSEVTPSPPLASPGLPPLPATPRLPPKNEQSQTFSPPPPPPPPPPSDRDLYEKRPLPALPGGPQPSGTKRHSGSSTLSRELKAAFATPHQSGSFFEGEGDDAQPGSQSQPQQEKQEHPDGGISAAASDDMSDWEETEIPMVLDKSAQHSAVQDVRFRGVSSSPSPSRHHHLQQQQQSEIFSPQPKSSMQKLLRLTGAGGSKASQTTNTSHPATVLGGGGSSGASSTPSGHNSTHKIKQLMGVDVAPRESSSSEFLRRARWSHQDDDVFASDQEMEISEGCFLDSDDDDSEEDVAVPVPVPVSVPMAAPTSIPTAKTERRNRFESENNSREESPVPAPLFISKNHRDLLLDADDVVVRPSSSAGERRLGLASSHQHIYSSSSSLHYKEDLYHRTTVQISRVHNTTAATTNKISNWRNSGSSMTGLTPPATRESHGCSSFGSNSVLIKPSNLDSDKPLPSPPPTASGASSSKVPDTPATWSSSPGLPPGRSLASPEPMPNTTTAPRPQPQQRKRATSTGAFGNIVNQKWQNWQSQHRQLTSPQQTKGGPKVRMPYDPAKDPHPGIRIILPYELEEEEFPVSSPTKSQHRASIVSSLLKRISGSASATPTSPAHGHKKRPSEPTTPTWLTNSGLVSSHGWTATPTSSPVGGIPPPLALLDALSFTPIAPKVVSPTSAAAATIPISPPTKLAGAVLEVPPVSPPSLSDLPKSQPPVTHSSTVTKAEHPQHQLQLQPQPQAPSRLNPVRREQLPGNQRSSFSISEPPSPILSGLASLGHLNLSSGTLGLGSFTSRARDDRNHNREDRGGASGGGGKRSVSSLGFRSPDKLNLQMQLGPGLRAVADRSTLIAQRTNELVGQVGKSLIGKTVKGVGKTKRLGSLNLKAAGGGSGSDGRQQQREGNKEGDEKKEKDKDKGAEGEEKWREDIKAKIRVLDDGGRVLGAAAGSIGGPEPGPLASPLLPIAMTHGGGGLGVKIAPERPERSPILPGTENEGWLSSHTPGVQESEGGEGGVIEGPRGTSTSTESDNNNNSTGQEPGKSGIGIGIGATGRSSTPVQVQGQGQGQVPMAGLRSPPPPPPPVPPVPPRSKNRPISGIIGFNNTNNVSALSSVGFGSGAGSNGDGSGGGSGSRSGSRPGSSRGILREAFAAAAGTGSAPGSRPGSRGQVIITVGREREGVGSRPGTPRDGAFTASAGGREGTEELETWV